MYLSYYSRMRNTMDGNVNQMIEAERGKIVTKVITQSNWDAARRHQVRVKATELLVKVRIWKHNNPLPMQAYYSTFRIPKRSGGYRTLYAPNESLKALQKDILKFLVEDCKLLCHNAVHSYVKHRNCKTAIAAHQRKAARWFLKVDIKDFFDGCEMQQAIDKLCDIHPLSILPRTTVAEILIVCFLNDKLPQGAPTSPIISNLYLLVFDMMLSKELKGFMYTRYADDLLISKTTTFRYTDVVNAINALLPQGLIIKREKIRYGSCNGTNWNLGLMYNKDRDITVGYRNKHRVKNRIHNLFNEPYNTYTQEERVGWFSRLCELKGVLAYYRFIEPEYFDTLIQRYRDKGYNI